MPSTERDGFTFVMHTAETIGASVARDGFTLAIIGGFLRYPGSHGVDLAPNPSRPGSATDTPARRAYFKRYNTRYVAALRVALRASLCLGVAGLALLVIGAVV